MGIARTASKPAKRPKRKDSYAALDRGLNAALERRFKETPKDRQKAFGRLSKRPPGVLDGW
jgi:hypothetical protein